MKKSRDNLEIYNDNNQIVALHLGTDYCTEHEIGIKTIKRYLHITEKRYKKYLWGMIKKEFEVIGIEARTVQDSSYIKYFNDTPIVLNNKKYWGFVLSSFDSINLKHKFTPYDTHNILGAWGDDSFLVLHNNKEVIADFQQAFENNDVAIWFGGGDKLFNKAGITFAIVSRLPQNVIDTFEQRDVSRNKLIKASNATGIQSKLKKAGKKDFALSPAWKDDKEEEVIFWLNPYNQHPYNMGWYTVEDLEQWCENKGKIPIKTK